MCSEIGSARELLNDTDRFVVCFAVVVFVENSLKNLAVQIGQTEKRHGAAQFQIIGITKDLAGCQPVQLQQGRGDRISE